MNTSPLRVRWLGRVRYRDAHALQHALFRRSRSDYLLLLEHDHVYTLGVRATGEHVLVDPTTLGAELIRVDRGGDVTYHGPGQLVGYPVVSVAMGKGSVPAYVASLEQLVIDALFDLGLGDTGRLEGFPGVWVEPRGENPRKICAIGVRVSRGRTMHGFALNVDPDLLRFDCIVPCGIADRQVTSLHEEGIDVSMRQVIEAVIARAKEHLAPATARARSLERQDCTAPGSAQGPTSMPTPTPVLLASAGSSPLQRRLAAAGVDPTGAVQIRERKPSWLRVEARMGEEYLQLKNTMRDLKLVTVCEEAGCPNIYECWADGTATFMINGERCTRACGFCLVDTRHPLPLDPDEPARVATAIAQMGLAHAVVTAVARDDLSDGGAGAFAATIEAIRSRCPETSIEVLVPDCKGNEQALQTLFAARPEVFNHNLETVLRLQRAVRPSASYARSLSVLARAKAAGLTTKSGIILGMGEREEEVLGALADLSSVGVDIVTIGQYLRPSAAHLPVARFWTPDEFAMLRTAAQAMGFSHVECSPLTRSSYHARQAIEAAGSRAVTA